MMTSLRTSFFATTFEFIWWLCTIIPNCHSFTPTNSYHTYIENHGASGTIFQRNDKLIPLHLFRELISDDEEDLRADISVIQKQDGLDEFLNVDDRTCVIKWVYLVFLFVCSVYADVHLMYINLCKILCTFLQSMQVRFLCHSNKFALFICILLTYWHCASLFRAFGIKFRKLATERGDRLNAAGETVRSGDARFAEIEYSSNTKLCKSLSVQKFPTVLIYQGRERIGEVVCKNQQSAIDEIISEMDQLLMMPSRKGVWEKWTYSWPQYIKGIQYAHNHHGH